MGNVSGPPSERSRKATETARKIVTGRPVNLPSAANSSVAPKAGIALANITVRNGMAVGVVPGCKGITTGPPSATCVSAYTIALVTQAAAAATSPTHHNLLIAATFSDPPIRTAVVMLFTPVC